MIAINLEQALEQNGVISEIFRRNRESLSEFPRSIISAVRHLARERGYSQKLMNGLEMSGERSMAARLPIKVKLRLAFYNSGEHHTPQPEYHIVASNHPIFPVNGNISLSDALTYGLTIPRTISYEKWVKRGRPCYRGPVSFMQRLKNVIRRLRYGH